MKRCAFPKCPGQVRAKGYCWPHYTQLRRADGDKSALKPLRMAVAVPLVRVSLRVPPPVATAVRGDAAGARGALTDWAQERASAPARRAQERGGGGGP